MNKDAYKVIFRGELVKGTDPEEIKKAVASKFKLNDSKVNILFSGEKKILKNNISFEVAKKLQENMRELGAVCSVEKNSIYPTDSQIDNKTEVRQEQQIGESASLKNNNLEKFIVGLFSISLLFVLLLFLKNSLTDDLSKDVRRDGSGIVKADVLGEAKKTGYSEDHGTGFYYIEKISNLIREEGFNLGLSCTDFLQKYNFTKRGNSYNIKDIYGYGEDFYNPQKVRKIGVGREKFPIELGFYGGTCSNTKKKHPIHLRKCIAILDGNNIDRKAVILEFQKKYGPFTPKAEHGYWATKGYWERTSDKNSNTPEYFFRYKDRYLSLSLDITSLQGKTSLSYILVDYTSLVRMYLYDKKKRKDTTEKAKELFK